MSELDILMKDYEIMRAELRMYIEKYYLAVAVIVGVITAGVMQIKDGKLGLFCLAVPYLIATVITFFTMLTFYINKTAGYVRLIEGRISKLCNGHFPDGQKAKLAPIIWESYYADLGMNRDSGKIRGSMYYVIISLYALCALIPFYIVLALGYQYLTAQNVSFMYKTGNVVLSMVIVGLAWWHQVRMEYQVRTLVINENNKLMAEDIDHRSPEEAINLEGIIK